MVNFKYAFYQTNECVYDPVTMQKISAIIIKASNIISVYQLRPIQKKSLPKSNNVT